MQLGRETFSPGVVKKVVTVAVETRSFARAEVVLQKVGEIEISSRHIGRISQQVGTRLADADRQRAEQHRQKKLPVWVQNLPRLAVIEVDGGRIRTRKEKRGSGTHDPAWRESKNALFMRMQSTPCETDPAPELPDSLMNRRHVRKLVQEMSGSVPSLDEEPEDAWVESSSTSYESPKRLMRTCLSSLANSDTFGRMMAAEAHRKGFSQAKRRAFVADGMKCNWTIWKKHFSTFVPIVDFIHVLSYVYHAAVAIGEGEEFGWGLCLEWARACWQGRATEVIGELQQWLERQPSPPPDEDLADDDPRRIVQRTLTYLTNNRPRMDYPKYRKQGLPVTSTLMESLIKEINYRVKGTEKFWNDPTGAEAILALRAASLSEDDRLASHLIG